MYKIGIVGRGFVGSAVEFGFSPNVGCDAEVRVYDKDPNKSLHSLNILSGNERYCKLISIDSIVGFLLYFFTKFNITSKTSLCTLL